MFLFDHTYVYIMRKDYAPSFVSNLMYVGRRVYTCKKC